MKAKGMLVFLLGLLLSAPLFAQEAIEKVGGGLDKVSEFLASYEGIFVFVLGMVVTVAKRISNEKAGPVIAATQKVLDVVPLMLEKLGRLLKLVCDLLAKALKSDGFLGKP